MHTLNPTKLQKRKLKDMVLHLFPTYKYVNISYKGTISLRKSFWWYIFFMSKKVDLTELCLVMVPEKLEQLKTKSGKYSQVFSEYGHFALDMMQLGKPNKVIDYLYNSYVDIKFGIIRNYNYINNILPENKYSLFNTNAIVLSPLSPSFTKAKLKKWITAPSKLSHPKLKHNYLNLWFKDEVKKQLNKIYELQVTLSYST